MPPTLVLREHALRERCILFLTLNRPDKRNCLNLELLGALIAAVREAPRDATLWFGGEGPAFSTGLDLQELFEMRSADRHLERLLSLLEAMRQHPAPTVCIVRTLASGGGVALAGCADVSIAAPGARFKLPGNAALRPLVTVVLPLISERRQIEPVHLRGLLGVSCDGARAQRERLADALEERDDFEVLWQTAELVRECKGLAARGIRRPPLPDAARAEVERCRRLASAPGALAPLMELLSMRYGSGGSGEADTGAGVLA